MENEKSKEQRKRDKQTFDLYNEGKTLDDIAKLMNIAKTTVRERIRRHEGILRRTGATRQDHPSQEHTMSDQNDKLGVGQIANRIEALEMDVAVARDEAWRWREMCRASEESHQQETRLLRQQFALYQAHAADKVALQNTLTLTIALPADERGFIELDPGTFIHLDTLRAALQEFGQRQASAGQAKEE